MTTRSDWRAEAPDLIRKELEKRLPGRVQDYRGGTRFLLLRGGGSSLCNRVLQRTLHPCEDTRRLLDIEYDIHNMLDKRGFDPVPSIDYLREGGSLT